MTTASAPSTLISAAGRIAESIVETAIVSGDSCTWLASSVDASAGIRQVTYSTGNPTVYEGDAGIAWALAVAGVHWRRDELLDVARSAISGALSKVVRYPSRGLYDGATGAALVALQIAETVDDAPLKQSALDVFEASTNACTQVPDIINGDAGVLLALLKAFEITGDERLLQRAMSLGQHLAECAYNRPWGICWQSDEPEQIGLCGLAHGVSGVAWALAELDHSTGEKRFEHLVFEALRYERSWFDREQNNWPDLRSGARQSDGGLGFPSWWCHGSTGIGTVRLRLRELGFGDPIVLAEACAALQSSFAASVRELNESGALGHGITVCHGLGGACDLFLTAHRVLGDPEHLATSRWLLEYAIGLLGSDPEHWPDGVGGRGGSAALMTGLAGTMITLIRAESSDHLPSVGLFPMI